MTRADLRRRIARLERPQSTRAALERELTALQQQFPHPTREQLETMSDADMDDFFRKVSAYTGPWVRMHEIQELLRTPEEQAELERSLASFEALSPEEQEAELDAMLNRERA